MTSARILAPAKINLGLAILGKRSDGYHEIDTIMTMIDLYDEIRLTESDAAGISISGMNDVPVESNLMTKAIRAWNKASATRTHWHIEITKRIPAPAGVGGGSSDASAVLKALNRLHNDPLSSRELYQLAASIGADCPFFLGDACARATGIGTILKPLPAPNMWAVLAIPQISVTAKTAALYGTLNESDYSSSLAIDEIENKIIAPDLALHAFPNSFSRPALQNFSSLQDLAFRFERVTGHWSLTGAGPAIYALTQSQEEATTWATELRIQCPSQVTVWTAQTLQTLPVVEILP